MSVWNAPGRVARVIDGDTVVVAIQLGWSVTMQRPVRLWGINAPEHATPEGQAATAFVAGLVPPGTGVTVVSHRPEGELDNYGRVLAGLTLLDGRDLSQAILDAGHAVPYPSR